MTTDLEFDLFQRRCYEAATKQPYREYSQDSAAYCRFDDWRQKHAGALWASWGIVQDWRKGADLIATALGVTGPGRLSCVGLAEKAMELRAELEQLKADFENEMQLQAHETLYGHEDRERAERLDDVDDGWCVEDEHDEHPIGCDCEHCNPLRCCCRYCTCMEDVEIEGDTCADCRQGAHQG